MHAPHKNIPINKRLVPTAITQVTQVAQVPQEAMDATVEVSQSWPRNNGPHGVLFLAPYTYILFHTQVTFQWNG